MTHRRKSLPLILIVLAILIFFLLFSHQSWFQYLRQAAFGLAAPGEGYLYSLSLKIKNFFNFLGSLYHLNQENISLKKENYRLLSRIVQLEEVAEENKWLRQQLLVKESQPSQMVVARVVSNVSFGLERSLLIDKGSNQGLKKGAIVISAGNLLIGQLIEVNPGFSKVRLINDINSQVNAQIKGSNLRGLVKGEADGSLAIDLTLAGQSFQAGQLVITSGLAGLWPAGLLIGQTEELVSTPVEPLQRIRLKPAVDFQKLKYVLVIIND